jgi:hypothetical protein
MNAFSRHLLSPFVLGLYALALSTFAGSAAANVRRAVPGNSKFQSPWPLITLAAKQKDELRRQNTQIQLSSLTTVPVTIRTDSKTTERARSATSSVPTASLKDSTTQPSANTYERFEGNWKYHTVCLRGLAARGTLHAKVSPSGRVTGNVSDGWPIIEGRIEGNSVFIRRRVAFGAIQTISLREVNSEKGRQRLVGRLTNSRLPFAHCRVTAVKK